MECRVEHRDLGRVREQLAQHVDACIGMWVVQGSELLAQREVGTRLVVEERRLIEPFATRDDAVANGL